MQNLCGNCSPMPMKQIANESAGQCVGTTLSVLVTGEEIIELIEIDPSAKHELIQELGLVFEAPTVLCSHRDAFIEPSWNRVARRGAADEHMCDLVPQDIIQCAVRIRR